jgi:hypothetical protein
VALTLVLGLLLCPFLNKALHIDDPLFVWAARHIHAQPANPYGFTVNWYGTPMPMSEVTKNPPLAAYYLALAASVAGWSEGALHVAFLLPAFAVAIGTFLLARRYCRRPLLGASAAVFTPVFFVSSLTIMSDMMMLAWWVFAVYCWQRGLDRRHHAWLACAAACIAAASLTKYFGMALIPLLFTYTVARERRAGWPLLYLLLPVGVLAGYQWATGQVYGRGLLLDAAAYATSTDTDRALTMPRLWANIAFAGGCLASVAFLAPRLWSRRAILIGLVGATLLLAVTFPLMSSSAALPADRAACWWLALQLDVWGATGLSLLALAVLDVRSQRNADALLLFLWIVGTFVFAGFVNWTTNGRSMLPMIVPAGILVARRLERRAAPTSPRRWPGPVVPLAAAAALAVAVLGADAAAAGAARAGAAAIGNQHPAAGHDVWFQGHWGFQYYMEQQGAKPLDVSNARLSSGDWVVAPTSNTNLYALPPSWAARRATIDVPSSRWLVTMDTPASAGFYDFAFGLLPFAIGPVPSERFTIYEVVPR